MYQFVLPPPSIAISSQALEKVEELIVKLRIAWASREWSLQELQQRELGMLAAM